jgi:hypothetical protein
MTRARLTERIARLREVAARNKCVLKAELGPPATDSELHELEDFVGAPPPRSLVALLKMHNGISLEMFEAPHVVPQVDFFSYNTLQLLGTRDLISRTEDLRGFVDVDLEAERERAWRCFEFASNDGPLHRIVFSLDAKERNAEYAIFDAWIDTSEWIDEVLNPSRFAIATSVEEFIERSIASMLLAETYFYWAPEARKMWPD